MCVLFAQRVADWPRTFSSRFITRLNSPCIAQLLISAIVRAENVYTDVWCSETSLAACALFGMLAGWGFPIDGVWASRSTMTWWQTKRNCKCISCRVGSSREFEGQCFIVLEMRKHWISESRLIGMKQALCGRYCLWHNDDSVWSNVYGTERKLLEKHMISDKGSPLPNAKGIYFVPSRAVLDCMLPSTESDQSNHEELTATRLWKWEIFFYCAACDTRSMSLPFGRPLTSVVLEVCRRKSEYCEVNKGSTRNRPSDTQDSVCAPLSCVNTCIAWANILFVNITYNIGIEHSKSVPANVQSPFSLCSPQDIRKSCPQHLCSRLLHLRCDSHQIQNLKTFPCILLCKP